MSAELVPLNNEIAEATDRRAALERLNIEAETVSTPEEAREIMVKGKLASDLLAQAQAPFEEARLAGKASVLAARRLAAMIAAASSERKGRPAQSGGGYMPTERGQLVRDLGLATAQKYSLMRLSSLPDADFQRYIQLTDRIPTVHGAIRMASAEQYERFKGEGISPTEARRRKANVVFAKNPSLDEAYSLITRALGHISRGTGGNQKKRSAISAACEHLYAAEDLLKPYRAGYGE